MSSPINRLFDAAMQTGRCVKCGHRGSPGSCRCWERCSCGWWADRGEPCRNPKTRRCSSKLRAGILSVRDLHLLPGPKRFVEKTEADVEHAGDADAVVRAICPTARVQRQEGAPWNYHWMIDGEVVAEAWLHRTRPGWWVRVRRAEVGSNRRGR